MLLPKAIAGDERRTPARLLLLAVKDATEIGRDLENREIRRCDDLSLDALAMAAKSNRNRDGRDIGCR